MRFVDTNVLLYATSVVLQEAPKRLLARELLNEDDLAISVQVLQEFYYQANRPNQLAPLTHNEALEFLVDILKSQIHPVTLDIFHSAIAISRRFQLSYWDGAILAAARALGCEAVYSEDMSAEQDYDGLRVINPFAAPYLHSLDPTPHPILNSPKFKRPYPSGGTPCPLTSPENTS